MADNGRLKWSKFFWRDWLGDAQVRQLSFACRAAWMDLLCLIAESGEDGTIQITEARLAKVIGCTKDQANAFLVEMAECGVADMEGGAEFWTVTCRRMAREAKGRESERERWRRRSSAGVSPESDRSSTGVSPEPSRGRARSRGQRPEARGQIPETRDQEARDQRPNTEPAGAGPPADAGAVVSRIPPIDLIEARYRELFPDSRVTSKAREKVRARLREGFSEDDLLEAIEGCASSPWHREKGLTALAWICASGDKVEMFRGKRRALDQPVVNEDTIRSMRAAEQGAELYEAMKARERRQA